MDRILLKDRKDLRDLKILNKDLWDNVHHRDLETWNKISSVPLKGHKDPNMNMDHKTKVLHRELKSQDKDIRSKILKNHKDSALHRHLKTQNKEIKDKIHSAPLKDPRVLNKNHKDSTHPRNLKPQYKDRGLSTLLMENQKCLNWD